MATDLKWGLDLGGTKIEGVVLDGVREVVRLREDTEADQGYAHILDQMARVVQRLEEESGVARPAVIGVGTPGTTEPSTGLLKNSNTGCLIGQPLGSDLSRRLGVRCILANDANCFALAEATLGAAKDAGVVFGVIMGTGVGGGLVVNGKVISGQHGIAGEWGHNVLVPGGRACYCGKRGCVEKYISGKGAEWTYLELTGETAKLRDIASSPSPAARETIRILCEQFGQALSVVANILDPAVFVIGGGASNVAELYTDGRDSLSRWMFNPTFEGKLLPPQHGDSAGVYGAAMLTA